MTSRKWGTPEEVERRNRIRIALWAYAYEIMDDPLVTDAEFDALGLLIDPSLTTGNRKLDRFFEEHFTPSTGMWVRNHPDQRGLHRLYQHHRSIHADIRFRK